MDMHPLERLHEAEIPAILWLQGLGDWLAPVMSAASFVGTEIFFLALLPLIYWCVSPRLGLRLGVVLLSVAGLNAIFKLAGHAPRPYWIDGEVRPMSTEPSFGIPSGHAQVSAAVWGVLAAESRRRTVWAAAAALILVISLSRVYLGVHFFSDIVGGLVLGLILLWLVLRLEGPAVAWWRGRSLAAQTGLAFAASAVILGGGLLATMSLGDWIPPADWIGAEEARNLDTLVAMSGAFAGMLIGATLMYRLGWFSAAGPWTHRAARFLLGAAGVAIIYIGLREILPEGDSVIANVFRYLRYGLLTLWVQLGAPLLFLRLRLTSPEPSSTVAAAP